MGNHSKKYKVDVITKYIASDENWTAGLIGLVYRHGVVLVLGANREYMRKRLYRAQMNCRVLTHPQGVMIVNKEKIQ